MHQSNYFLQNLLGICGRWPRQILGVLIGEEALFYYSKKVIRSTLQKLSTNIE
jgi:hypothetical protein